MKKLVYKFGGSSLRDHELRSKAIAHVKKAVEAGHELLVVVSAMGRKGDPYATDTLLGLIEKDSTARVRDLVMSCGEQLSACVFAEELRMASIASRPFNACGAGILGEGEFGEGEISGIEGDRLEAFLKKGVPVVTGFQACREGEVMTLGRGGSDTSAVVLAHLLKMEEVHIFTDVAGVYPLDPRLAKDAEPVDLISYEDMLNLARWGAGVLHPKAVERAMSYQMPLRVRSTFLEEGGTLVSHRPGEAALRGISLLECSADEVMVSLLYYGNPALDDGWTKSGEHLFQKKVDKAQGRKLAVALYEDLK